MRVYMYGIFRPGAKRPSLADTSPDEAWTTFWLLYSGGDPRDDYIAAMQHDGWRCRRVRVETTDD